MDEKGSWHADVEGSLRLEEPDTQHVCVPSLLKEKRVK
jgi:hypothetical protein